MAIIYDTMQCTEAWELFVYFLRKRATKLGNFSILRSCSRVLRTDMKYLGIEKKKGSAI